MGRPVIANLAGGALVCALLFGLVALGAQLVDNRPAAADLRASAGLALILSAVLAVAGLAHGAIA